MFVGGYGYGQKPKAWLDDSCWYCPDCYRDTFGPCEQHNNYGCQACGFDPVEPTDLPTPYYDYEFNPDDRRDGVYCDTCGNAILEAEPDEEEEEADEEADEETDTCGHCSAPTKRIDRLCDTCADKQNKQPFYCCPICGKPTNDWAYRAGTNSKLVRSVYCHACDYEWETGDLSSGTPEPNAPLACPACGSDNATYLGRLGRREHYRCRACGMDFSREEADPKLDSFAEEIRRMLGGMYA
jgi:hypothetical protein